jgi:tRNA nucleotidyltransferase/poly(A) polymerase
MWRLADLAKGPDKAEIIDLAGCGLRDLKAGSMRCPSDPDKTFSDDPTRMLRAIKFANKYGFKITPDTEASIRRNAGKLRNAPPAAIAKLLVGVILKEPKTAKRALQQMKQLGLLDVVAQMARDDRSFQATLSGWANDQRVGLLFDLLDMGLPVKTKLGAFSAAEQARIRKVTATMPDDRAQAFLAALKQPGRAWKDKLFFAALAAELGATGKTIGELAQRVNGIARDALLAEPRLLDDPAKLKQIVRDAVKGARFEMTLSTNVATTPVPVGAGDGRKFLDFGPGHPYHGRCFDDPECKKKKRKKRRGLSKRLSYLLTIP